MFDTKGAQCESLYPDSDCNGNFIAARECCACQMADKDSEHFCCHYEQWTQYSTCELYSGANVVEQPKPKYSENEGGHREAVAYAFKLDYTWPCSDQNEGLVTISAIASALITPGLFLSYVVLDLFLV